jgi:hypothetical protein
LLLEDETKIDLRRSIRRSDKKPTTKCRSGPQEWIRRLKRCKLASQYENVGVRGTPDRHIPLRTKRTKSPVLPAIPTTGVSLQYKSNELNWKDESETSKQ